MKDGTPVTVNQPIAQLDPAADVVLNALAALYFIGHENDIPAIAPYLRNITGMPLSVSAASQADHRRDSTRMEMPPTVKP